MLRAEVLARLNAVVLQCYPHVIISAEKYTAHSFLPFWGICDQWSWVVPPKSRRPRDSLWGLERSHCCSMPWSGRKFYLECASPKELGLGPFWISSVIRAVAHRWARDAKWWQWAWYPWFWNPWMSWEKAKNFPLVNLMFGAVQMLITFVLVFGRIVHVYVSKQVPVLLSYGMIKTIHCGPCKHSIGSDASWLYTRVSAQNASFLGLWWK